MLESFGRTVLSADQEARALMMARPSLKRRLSRTFGTDVYRPDGTLDRVLLAERAFQNANRTRELNAIVHPAVVRELQSHIRRLRHDQRCPYVVVEAALVYESGLDAALDVVVVIDAPRELRIQRILKRDGTSRSEVLRRMRTQLPAAHLKKWADFVIMNTHDTTVLRSKVAFLNALLVAISPLS